MGWTERMIHSGGDVLCYFGAIQKTVPKSVCDYGMFLCRCASVARGIGGYTISKDIFFAGVDPFPEDTPRIYQYIYDKIYQAEDLPQEDYDLGVLLRLAVCVPEEGATWCEHALNHCRWLVTDETSYHYFAVLEAAENIGRTVLEGEEYIFIKGRKV